MRWPCIWKRCFVGSRRGRRPDASLRSGRLAEIAQASRCRQARGMQNGDPIAARRTAPHRSFLGGTVQRVSRRRAQPAPGSIGRRRATEAWRRLCAVVRENCGHWPVSPRPPGAARRYWRERSPGKSGKTPATVESAVFRGAVYGRLFTAPKGAVECRSFVLSRAKCADASNLQNLSAKATTKRRIRFRVVGKGQTD